MVAWYSWALLSSLFGSGEVIIDKALVVRRTMDSTVGPFFRNLAFWLLSLVLGAFGVFGSVSFFFSPLLLAFAAVQVGRSLTYDYFLKNHEASRFSSIMYVFPFVLVFTDRLLFGTQYLLLEFTGILFLLVGGFFFSYQVGEGLLFSAKDWGLFAFNFISTAAEYIVFKHYSSAYGVNEITFYASAWLIVTLMFALLIFAKRKQRIVLRLAKENAFFAKTCASKLFDLLSGLAVLRAVALATVAKAYAVTAFFPMILLATIWLFSRITSLDLKEELSGTPFALKALGAMSLCGGILLLV